MSKGESETYRVCRLSEVPENGQRRFVVNGHELLIIRMRGEVYCIEPLCTHIGSDISRGKVDRRAGTIECPVHGALFDIPSGEPLMGPYGSDGDILPPLRLYKLRIIDGEVYLEKRQGWGEI